MTGAILDISSGVSATAFFSEVNLVKHSLLFIAILMVWSTASMAADHTHNRQFINEQLQLDRQRFRALPSPGILPPDRVLAPEHQSFVDAQAEQMRRQAQQDAKPGAPVMVFVSFSMPENELKTRVGEAAALKIPVVLRGMVNGDMRQTANAVAKLVKDTNNGGVQIDPTAFRRYGVTAVPVLIVVCGEQGEHHDRLQGDLVLREGLRRIAGHGECAETAAQLLNEGEPS